jgi:Phosphatidylinositol-4-phosphate 5-Kinase
MVNRTRRGDLVCSLRSLPILTLRVCMLFSGCRYSSELLKDSEDVEPTPADFRESLAFDFNPVNDQRSSSVFDVNKYAKWVHPAPFVYRRIRAKFGIPEQDFLDATCGESRVRELPTPGKSGQIFYITDDENYFMKTIDHEEEKVLLQMLPAYYAHVSHHPHTFLTRYLAHFSVETTRNRHIRMVVMASVFNDSIFIDKKYDLKGSTFNRIAKPDELQSENVTLKDLDFDAPIFFNPDVVERIHGQLEKDTAFLEAHHVMDYSLLLGMSEMLPEEDALYKESYGEDEATGPYYIGYQNNADGVLIGHRICVGVIDFLQRFRTRKRVEYGCRVLQTCSSGSASVAPPSLYRSRFLKFLKTRLLPDTSISAPGPGLPTVSPSVTGPNAQSAAETGTNVASPFVENVSDRLALMMTDAYERSGFSGTLATQFTGDGSRVLSSE